MLKFKDKKYIILVTQRQEMNITWQLYVLQLTVVMVNTPTIIIAS